MSLADLFKPKIKHHDPERRIEALKNIKNEQKLASLVLNDPSDRVKSKAIEYITDVNIFSKILLPDYKKNSLPQKIIKKLFNEMDKKKLTGLFFKKNAASNGIEKYIDFAVDKNSIANIINSSKNKNIIRKLFHKLENFYTKPDMAEFILNCKNKKAAAICINEINDIGFLEELINRNKSTKIKRTLKKKLNSLRPDYLKFKVQRHCPDCGYPVMINGPVLKIKCRTCLSIFEIKKSYWKSLFRLSADSGVFIMGRRVGDSPGMPEKPACNKCGTELPADDIPDNSETDIKCENCSALHSSYPAPDWMENLKNNNNKFARHIFCAVREDDKEREEPEEPKPIAFHCINCSGPLEFNINTPRIMKCKYCNTDQYLPDSLWHALHPVVKIRPWYIRFRRSKKN